MKEMILPTPDRFFEWRATRSGPALVCLALEPWAVHLFTTRHWPLGSSTTEARDAGPWNDVAIAMGVRPASLVRLRQVHGTAVSEAAPDAEPCAADVIVTSNPDLAIAVQAADCVPLLLTDSRTGAVAAAHAGWRGLAARLPSLAVQAMASRFGSRPADLVVAVGPSIGSCCYEVGLDVREAFVEAGCSQNELRAWFSDTPQSTSENPSIARPFLGGADRWFFDGWRTVRDQLRAAQVPDDRIFSSNVCTASHPGAMCSYRRDGAPAGRIAGAIRSPRRRP